MTWDIPNWSMGNERTYTRHYLAHFLAIFKVSNMVKNNTLWTHYPSKFHLQASPVQQFQAMNNKSWLPKFRTRGPKITGVIEQNRQNFFIQNFFRIAFSLFILTHRMPILTTNMYWMLIIYHIDSIQMLGNEYHGHGYESPETRVKHSVYQSLRLSGDLSLSIGSRTWFCHNFIILHNHT